MPYADIHIWRDDFGIWRDNLIAGIFLLENGGRFLEDVLGCFGWRPEPLTPQNDRAVFEERYHTARERGIQNFTSKRPGWFFISAEPRPGKFRHLSIAYTTTQSQTVVLDGRYISSPRETHSPPFPTGSIHSGTSIVAEEILDEIRAAISTDNLDSVNRVASAICKDEMYGRLLEIVAPRLKRGDVRLVPFVELLLRSQYLVTTSENPTEEDLFQKRFELALWAFDTLRKSSGVDNSIDFALEDAYDQLLAIESRNVRLQRTHAVAVKL